MSRIVGGRRRVPPGLRDRGEVGPIGYAVMVAGIVLLALAVVAWGNDLADRFMGRLDDIDVQQDAG
ncbi:MAG: hypothetical protein FWJ70_11305 [Micromonosporaceae bacterium]